MIAVTGAGGQLGTELRAALAGRAARFLTSAELDITNAAACRSALEGVSAVINAAAYTKVDRAEAEEGLAMAVNAEGPRNLAVAARAVGARLVHISTDYVFDGTRREPYTEDDVPNPQTAYGRTKLAGERAVLGELPEALVVRTGWLYAAHGHNFLRTMLRIGAEKAEVRVVNDQTGTPTHAGHLARDLVAMLDSGQGAGLYHYADEGEATWFDFAREIMHAAGLACAVKPIPTSAYPTPAVRPAYSVLDKGRVKSAFGLRLNNWRDDIESCVKAAKAR
jgi:dTDP-4-dehydrorhamnose reductase